MLRKKKLGPRCSHIMNEHHNLLLAPKWFNELMGHSGGISFYCKGALSQVHSYYLGNHQQSDLRVEVANNPFTDYNRFQMSEKRIDYLLSK
jgi:hypothetical protein